MEGKEIAVDITPQWEDVIEDLLRWHACQGKSKAAVEQREFATGELRRLALVVDRLIQEKKLLQEGKLR